MKRVGCAVLLIALLLHTGCGYAHKPAWGHRWGKGTWIPALVCGVVGAGTGIGIQYGVNGCSTGTAINVPPGEDRTREKCDYDLPEEAWQGALIGAGVGAA